MSRNRLIYNSLGVFTSPQKGAIENQTGLFDNFQLSRIQSFDFDFSKNLEDINALGSLSSVNRLEIESPIVNINLSYLLTNGLNEEYINLNVYNPDAQFEKAHCLNKIITQNNEQNYYLLVSDETLDLNNKDIEQTGIIGFGNACLTSYNLNASIGSIPTVDINLEALNVNFITDNATIKKDSFVYYQKITGGASFLSGDQFGTDIKISNNVILLGGPQNSESGIYAGAVAIFTGNSNNGWNFKQKLWGDSTQDYFGRTLDSNNDSSIIVVGAPEDNFGRGSVFIYTGNKNQGWNFKQKITGEISSLGSAVGLNSDGSVLIIGDPRYSAASLFPPEGGIFIYTGNATNGWILKQTITGATSPGRGIGRGVSINGDGSIFAYGDNYSVIGASNIGSTFIYTGNVVNGWDFKQRIFGLTGSDEFGSSSAISNNGDTIVIGSPGDGSSNLGASFVYTGNSTTGWQLRQKLQGSITEAYFGYDVDINPDGNTIIMGGNFPLGSSPNGASLIFTGNAIDGWNFRQEITGDNNGRFGTSVSISEDGNVAVMGGPSGPLSHNSGAGIIYTIQKVSEKVPNRYSLPSVDPEEVIDTNNLYFTIYPQNINSYTEQVSALQAGDIQFILTGAFGFDNTNLKVQDFNLNFELPRIPLKKVGKEYPFVRELTFPIKAQLEINTIVGNLEQNNLTDLICNKESYDFNIAFNEPCTKKLSAVYEFKGAKLISQNFTTDIGNNSTMSAVYEVDISDINNSNKGLFISGNICQNIFWDKQYTYTGTIPEEIVSGSLNGKTLFGINSDLNYDGSIIAVSDSNITTQTGEFAENEGGVYIFTGNLNNGWVQKQFITGTTYRGILGEKLNLNTSGTLLYLFENNLFGGPCSVIGSRALLYTGSQNNEWVLKQSFCAVDLIFQDGSVILIPSGSPGFPYSRIDIYTGNTTNGWSKYNQTFSGGSVGFPHYYYNPILNTNGNIISFVREETITNDRFFEIYTGNTTNGWALKQSMPVPTFDFSSFREVYPKYISDNGDLLFAYSGQSIGGPPYLSGYINIYSGSYENDYVLFQSIPSLKISEIFSNYDSSIITVNTDESQVFQLFNFINTIPTFSTYYGNIKKGWSFNQGFFYKNIADFNYKNISRLSNDGNILTAAYIQGGNTGYLDIYSKKIYTTNC